MTGIDRECVAGPSVSRPPVLNVRPTITQVVTLHSLMWLVAGNAVGLLLAALLLWPSVGVYLTPFTYGRWMPLHLDFQLYGWAGLPLVGLVLRAYTLQLNRSFLLSAAVSLWSGALLFAAAQWLAGGSSGKLFLEWSLSARALLCLSLALLVLVLLIHQFSRGGSLEEPRGFGGTVAAASGAGAFALRASRWLGLACLATVPFVVFWAGGASVYPSINPSSGGATASALMGSSLFVIVILAGFPSLLGLQKKVDGGASSKRTAIVMALHWTWFALLDHGDVSNRNYFHVAALSSLTIWLPLLVMHWRTFVWPVRGRLWLLALAGWGAMLLASGITTFMPGILEMWKFSNALVAHAHVAMAGVVTSFNALLLSELNESEEMKSVFIDPTAFWLWHLGLGAFAASLMVVGHLEGGDPGILFRNAPLVTVGYGIRLAGGLLMFLASVQWLRRSVGALEGAAL